MAARTIVASMAVLAACAAGSVQAADTYWSAGTSNWSIGGNWTAGEPNSSTTAYITNGGTAQITASGEACYILQLGSNSGQSGHVSMSSGSLTGPGL